MSGDVFLGYPVDEYGEGLSGTLKPEPRNGFQRLQEEIHQTAQAKGWWDKPRTDSDTIILFHSEISEAVEALRNGDPMSEKIPEFSQLEEELADTVIRIMDYAEHRGIDLWSAIVAKSEYNKGRSYRRGGKRF
jgi:NTP pyrophosphatase (non-canonical NTP hydrolase)